MAARSEQLTVVLKEIFSESAEQQPMNEGGDLRKFAVQAMEAASKVWEKYLKTELEAPLRDLGFSKKSFEVEFKPGTFEVEYVNKKLEVKVQVYGTFFGGSSSAHYLQLAVYGPHSLLLGKKIEDFDKAISLIKEALSKMVTGG
jgi:hypothetical protein